MRIVQMKESEKMGKCKNCEKEFWCLNCYEEHICGSMVQMKKCKSVRKEMIGVSWLWPLCCDYHKKQNRRYINKMFKEITAN